MCSVHCDGAIFASRGAGGLECCDHTQPQREPGAAAASSAPATADPAQEREGVPYLYLVGAESATSTRRRVNPTPTRLMDECKPIGA